MLMAGRIRAMMIRMRMMISSGASIVSVMNCLIFISSGRSKRNHNFLFTFTEVMESFERMPLLFLTIKGGHS